MKRLPLVAAVLALPACGSSNAGTLTKAQYDANVNQLCLRSADAFRELHLDNTVADWKHYASNIIHIDRHFVATLSALKPPPAIAAEAAIYKTANEKVLKDDEVAVVVARAGDSAMLWAAIARANRDDRATFPSAKKIGATACYIG